MADRDDLRLGVMASMAPGAAVLAWWLLPFDELASPAAAAAPRPQGAALQEPEWIELSGVGKVRRGS